MDRIVIAQGGGPTAVINETLVGVIEAAREAGIKEIWGARRGVQGMVEGDFVDLSPLSNEHLQDVATTPAAALFSTRDKPNDVYCRALWKIVTAHRLDGLFYIGGNDTCGTLMQLANYGGESRNDFRVVHVPKTIDNDLVCNDHVPGYGSAARYVACAFRGLDFDQRALRGIHLVVVMGRHAGFLTAASAALRTGTTDGPHIICLPEDVFDEQKFLKKVKEIYQTYGRCLIAVSEGIQNEQGTPIITQLTQLVRGQKDAHGNVQLSGSGALGDLLAARIKDELKIERVRADTLGYMQRSFPSARSDRDATEARMAGRHAVTFALKEQKNGSVTLNLNDRGETIYGYETLEAIGGKTRYLPEHHWARGQFNVTDEFIQWVRPLLGKGLPSLVPLKAETIGEN